MINQLYSYGYGKNAVASYNMQNFKKKRGTLYERHACILVY